MPDGDLPRHRQFVAARSLGAMALVLLAIATAPRIPLEYSAAVSLPEIRLALSLPPSMAGDPTETTIRWLLPIESAVRSLGDVVATRGNVAADGANLTVRFRRGVSAELKTARLVSELSSLRGRLPEGARLGVWPSIQNSARPGLVIALTGSGAAAVAAQIAGELRAAEGVREVQTWGAAQRELLVRLRDSAPPSVTPRDVQLALRTQTEARRLGTVRVGGFVRPLIIPREANRPGDVRVAAGPAILPLASVADIREGSAAPETLARIDGRDAVVLLLFRDDDVPLFRFERSVREQLDASLRSPDDLRLNGGSPPRSAASYLMIWNEAAELRSLLEAIAIGLLAGAGVLAAAGASAGGIRGTAAAAYIPLSAAISIQLAFLTSLHADTNSIIAACIAIAAFAPLALRRIRNAEERGRVTSGSLDIITLLAFGALILLAVTFGSGALAPFLAGPARGFMTGAVAAGLAAALLPVVPQKHSTRGRGVRRILRDAPAVALGTGAAVYLLLTWFGTKLDPRDPGRTAAASRLYATVTLPQGATLAQTAQRASVAERALRGRSEIRRFWTVVAPETARITIELVPGARTANTELLMATLRAAIALPAGMLHIEPQFDRSTALQLSDDVEERPDADDEGLVYRVVLKSTSIDALRTAYERVADRLTRSGLRRSNVAAQWGASSSRLELVPRAGVSSDAAAQAAAQLQELSTFAPGRERPDGTLLRVEGGHAPRAPSEVVPAADLFARRIETTAGALTVATAFVPRRSVVLGSVERELGRFILPVSIRVPGFEKEQVLKRREDIDRALGLLALPPDTSLARPALDPWHLSVEKLRLFALAASVPLLLFTAAVAVLNSFGRALMAMAPGTAAVAAVAPMLLASSTDIDEIALFACAAALCCATGLAVAALRKSTGNATAYRTARDAVVQSLAGALAAVAILGIPASIEAAGRDEFRAPLVAAATVLFVTCGGGSVIAAALVAVESEWRRRAAPATRALRRPAPWRDAAMTPHVSVRNVTKVYAGGFRALHRVSFNLDPGVIGLLGPNGAGKTTLLRIMTGLLLPTRGELSLQGVAIHPDNLADYRRMIGFLPQEFNAYSGFTGEQFIDYWAVERGIGDPAERQTLIERLLAEVGLSGAARRRVRDYSGGMRQRIGIARALIGDPLLLIVDEPTTGLDIEARQHFREVMRTIARNRIVILSTHIASDVEAAASRILLLDRGALRFDGTSEQLLARAEGRVFEAIVSDDDARELSRLYRVTTRVRVPGGIRIRAVVPAGEPLRGAAAAPTLEEAYLAEVATRERRHMGSFAFLSPDRTQGLL